MRSLSLVSSSLPFLLLAACAQVPPAPTPAAPPARSAAPSASPAAELESSSVAEPAPSAPASQLPPAQSERRAPNVPDLQEGHTLLQGFIGASLFETVDRDGGSFEFSEEPDFDTFPLIGGGGQWVLGGGQLDFGIEGGFGFGFRTEGGAFIAGGGGAVVAVDVNVLLIDVYTGLFASTFLGNRWRLYGGVGPLMQFADYDIDAETDGGSGFGVGYYGRTGLEYVLANRAMIGVGARWIASEVDLSNDLGDLEVEGTQVFLTVTTGL
jgi:hypothetical protein